MKFFSTVFKVSLIFLEISFNFFQKLPSAYAFINWINLSNFVKIILDTYLNFIKLSNVSKIFWKTGTKFQLFFCKIYKNFIHNLFKFLKNFLKDFQNFREILTNIPIFFQNFNEYYSKLILFSNFHLIFSRVPQSFIEILSSFWQISQILFQRFTQSR